jgi:hypothetical protein
MSIYSILSVIRRCYYGPLKSGADPALDDPAQVPQEIDPPLKPTDDLEAGIQQYPGVQSPYFDPETGEPAGNYVVKPSNNDALNESELVKQDAAAVQGAPSSKPVGGVDGW